MKKYKNVDEKEISKDSSQKPTIQSLAEFFGWNRKQSVIVKTTDTEIAPNGTRRERRINNNFIPEEGGGINYIAEINQNIKKGN